MGICGAGLGGVSAAIGLARLGCDVEVFEKAPALRATGSGLNLWPNAGRAIYGLGLRDEFDAIAVKLDRYLGFAPEGGPLFECDTSAWPEKYGAPSVGVSRLALITMLADAYGADRIRFGHEVVSVENFDDRAVCHFSNGARHEFDVLIGADGIYSTIREQLIGGVRFRPNNHHAYRWRAIVDLAETDVDPAAQTGYYAQGGWLAVIPIGNGKAYWFGSVSGGDTVEDFMSFFQSWTNTHIPRTLSITPPDAIIKSPLYDVEGTPYKWTHGRVTLMGDAAHPMMPDLAQGASQAFIDSLSLRDAFATTNDIDEALLHYETDRYPAANYVVNCSRKGSFRGKNGVKPIAVRYEEEIETVQT
ncbi:FAD-dependent monooxygenase [Acuticoccus sediminis]|uniref:FAD-dependent monooxygenase n=1 Tax=Acuticoccus sediminis TaxID=2184697 RepID=UPI001391683C|nr:FAD-dependent monooxygenase [Acuticoccus sediminis]